MYQLSLKILLAVLLFENLTFTVSIEEFNIPKNNSKELENILAGVGNTNDTDKQRTDQIDQADFHQKEFFKNTKRNSTIVEKENQKTSLNEKASTKELSPTLQSARELPIALNHTDQNINQRPVEETTPINGVTESQKSNDFIGEQKNLNECCVTPLDEDVTTIKTMQQENTNSSISTTSEITPTTTNRSVTITPKDVVSKITPASIDVNDTKKAGDLNLQLKPTMYETVPSELINATIETSTISLKSSEITTTVSSVITTVLTSENDQVKVRNDTVMLKKEKEVEHEGLSLKSKESISKEDTSGSMPPGIIALVTTITFAVAIIIGYISMVIWKQYLERKYGRRELLVNELEFDTNDLRHFEL